MLEKDCPSQEANLRVPIVSCVPDCVELALNKSRQSYTLELASASMCPNRIVSGHSPVGGPPNSRQAGSRLQRATAVAKGDAERSTAIRCVAVPLIPNVGLFDL